MRTRASRRCIHTIKFRLRQTTYRRGRGIGASFIGFDQYRRKVGSRASFGRCDILVARVRSQAGHLVALFMAGARRAASCSAKGRAYRHGQQREHSHKRNNGCGVRSNWNHFVSSLAFTLAGQFRSLGGVAAFAEKPSVAGLSAILTVGRGQHGQSRRIQPKAVERRSNSAQ